MKKITKKELLKLAEEYRKTMDYPALAELAEYTYLQTQWDNVEKLFLKNRSTLRLSDVIGITIGTWQVKNGFYLTSEQVFEKRVKK